VDIVTGVSGFLGLECLCVCKERLGCNRCIFHNHPVTINGVRTLKIDITDYKSVEALMDQIKPDALIHTAAVTDPNYCQNKRTISEGHAHDRDILTTQAAGMR